MKRGNVREVWTSGRLCDKEVDGCEQDRFQPYNIRGWFWASTLQSMGETNVFNGRKVRARGQLEVNNSSFRVLAGLRPGG